MSKTSVAMSLLHPIHPDDPNNMFYNCKIETCKALLSANTKWNLVKHFETSHASIFKDEIRKANSKSEENNQELEQRRLEVIQQTTEIVTVNGRPFKCLSDSGLMGLRSRELKYLKDAGYGDGLTGDPPPTVLNHIEYLSAEITSAITLEVKSSLVSLMVDIGSKNRRDILGISIQYMRDDCVIIRSIGMLQITKSHTAAHVKSEIMTCLQKFGIAPNQVISITSDNASNMIAMVKLFNRSSGSDKNENGANGSDSENEVDAEIDESEQSEELLRDANIYDDDYINAQIEGIFDEFNSIQNMSPEELREAEEREAEIQEILDDSSHYFDLLKLLQNEFAAHTLNSHGIRCAAHTLQLAMKKALKGKQIRVLIDMCRIASKMLRKASYKNRMHEQNLKIFLPRLDCAVRWNSTYRMVLGYFIQNSLLISTDKFLTLIFFYFY